MHCPPAKLKLREFTGHVIILFVCSSPKELNFWNNSKGDVALFICGTTWAGDGGRSSVNGACMVISLKSSAGDGDLLKPRTGEGEFLGLFFLGDGGLGNR